LPRVLLESSNSKMAIGRRHEAGGERVDVWNDWNDWNCPQAPCA
jgi:hypothetical protein